MLADDLHYFLELARSGRLVGAAHRLGVNHTTVGRRINQLERSLGTRLFDRAPTGWTLTEAGSTLLTYAESVETIVRAAGEDLKSTPGRLHGTVRIATSESFGAFVLLPGLRALRNSYPDLDFEVVTSIKLDLLASREVDIAVTVEVPPSRRHHAYPLADYHVSLYATEQYLASHREIKAVTDLHDHDLIGYGEVPLDVPSVRLFDSILPGHRLRIRTNSATGQCTAASAGLGIALLPEFVAHGNTQLVRVLPDAVRVARRYWAVVANEVESLGRTRVIWTALRTVVAADDRLAVCEP